jgi:hypothetical protein
MAMLCLSASVFGQNLPKDSLVMNNQPLQGAQTPTNPAKWYDKLNLHGYTQFRYNRLFETNPDLRCDQCDKGWGKGQAFEFRRARLIINGQVHDKLYVYFQFDYSSDASATNKNFLQVRDAYFDYSFDKKRTFRIRFGQSKVPFGIDNLQSSSQRLALDRTDAINSAAPNERDMGMFAYYAPADIRKLYKDLVDNGVKGSGDFGVVGFGVYNGQSSNKPELNDNLHTILRLTYPFRIGRQIVEPGVQGYTGKFTIAKDQLSTGVKVRSDYTYTDRRAAATVVLYPQPFGIQAEYNVGESPTFNRGTDSIRVQNLHGGYVTVSFRTKVKNSFLTPYVRYQTYDGGKKQETDARLYHVRETEIGLEWQVIKNLEITFAYIISHRQYQDLLTNYDQSGRVLKIQMQANY